MKKYILTFLALSSLLFFACQSRSNNTGVAKTGKEIYEIYCIACHGAQGNMMFNSAKDLTVSSLSISERKTLLMEGKGLMTPFKGTLSDEEISRVAKYSITLNPSLQ